MSAARQTTARVGADLYAALVDEYPMDCNDAPPFDAAEPFVLIERSTYDRNSHYLSLHETDEDAASYHDTQEYPDDWSIVSLVNLDTGECFRAVPSTSFEPAAFDYDRPRALQADR